MRYRHLETYAAIMTGVVTAVIGDLVMILMGQEPFGVVCLCSWFWWLVGVGAFLIVNEDIYRIRRRHDISTDKRRVKRVDFVVGKEIPGMPGYVEVRNERTAV